MSNINDLVEELTKSESERFHGMSEEYMAKAAKPKVVTRAGERFYSTGKHAGKKVGSVRGKGPKKVAEKKPSGAVQASLLSSLENIGGEVSLTRLSRHPDFRGVDFSRIQTAAEQLDKKGLISYKFKDHHDGWVISAPTEAKATSPQPKVINEVLEEAQKTAANHFIQKLKTEYPNASNEDLYSAMMNNKEAVDKLTVKLYDKTISLLQKDAN